MSLLMQALRAGEPEETVGARDAAPIILPALTLEATKETPAEPAMAAGEPRSASDEAPSAPDRLATARLLPPPSRQHRLLAAASATVLAFAAAGLAYAWWTPVAPPPAVIPAVQAAVAAPPPAAVPPRPETPPPAPKPAPKSSPPVRPAEAPPSDPPSPGIRFKPAESTGTTDIAPLLEHAYKAFLAGDDAAAESIYAQVLAADSRNRDALLGLAAVSLHRGEDGQAEVHYRRALELNPRDAAAQAGLLALRPDPDPVRAESRIKALLAREPDAPYLHFALGNLRAAQQRWPAAQQAYVNAYAAAPDNGDYAHNVAVALDHLQQPRLARDYYRRALASPAGGFDRTDARRRLAELEAGGP